MAKPYIPLTTTLTELDCQVAFNALAQTQAKYAYNFARASWHGSKICYFERSFQSPALLYIILRGFEQGAKQTVEALRQKFDEVSINQILIYVAAFIDNNGNYKSFGDTKFIPECSEETFEKFFQSTPYWSAHSEQFESIYNRISKLIFNSDIPYGLIDFSNKNGTTGYYSKNISSDDAEKIKGILIKKGLRSENNRLTKQDDTHYTVKIASVVVKEEQLEEQGIHITLKYGEFGPFLHQVNHYLSEAKKYVANQIQAKMIDQYIVHFEGGDMQKHIQSQKFWIQDKGPIIETNIGFIQTYLDPLKIRAQFEGFVAVVNQEQSLLLNNLVTGAEKTLKYLPWGEQFQVEVFKKPDFTSLDVLGFASSGIPVGINIPNYDNVREHFGFKNVNLGNAYGKPTLQSFQYVPQAEKQLHLKYYNPSLFVIVALHQLLGHGSGKLLHEKPTFASPLDGKEITTFYKHNETWGSVFGKIASFYEQCKADCVALYLSIFQDVQATLLPKYTQQQRWDIVYLSWFDLILGGVKGLEYYDVEHKKWLQAHIGASYAILSVLRQQGGIFEIKQVEKNGEPYLQVHLDKEAIKTRGKQAIGKFLKHLQIYKSTADYERGTAFFQHYLEVDETFLKYREIVKKNKRPRRLTVQPDVKLVDGKVQYIKFENTTYGQIESALSHYNENIDDILGEWEKNNQQFVY